MNDIAAHDPVMVTGASGYIGSWIVRYLLEEGFTVHGTIQNLKQVNQSIHLTQCADEVNGKLKLFEADLIQADSFAEAMRNCKTVIHTASPFSIKVKDPVQELIRPAVDGTENVLKTVNQISSVRRVVLTSSLTAVYGDAIELVDKPDGWFDERDWNLVADVEYQPYAYSKTLAEKKAWVLAEAQSRWTMVALQPGLVLGPTMSTLKDNFSTRFGLSLVNGQTRWGVPDFFYTVVDVRDVAKAHVLAALNPEVTGRCIVGNETLGILEMAAFLRTEFGKKYPLPKRTLPPWVFYFLGSRYGVSWKYILRNYGYPVRVNNLKSLEELGLTHRPVRETLIDQVVDFEQKGWI